MYNGILFGKTFRSCKAVKAVKLMGSLEGTKQSVGWVRNGRSSKYVVNE